MPMASPPEELSAGVFQPGLTTMAPALPLVLTPPPAKAGPEKLVPPKPKMFPLAPPPPPDPDEPGKLTSKRPSRKRKINFNTPAADVAEEDPAASPLFSFPLAPPPTKERMSFCPFPFSSICSFLLLGFFFPYPSGSLILTNVPPQLAWCSENHRSFLPGARFMARFTRPK